MKDYISHLNEGGVLSIGRFLMLPPRESLRLVTVAYRALEEMGVKDPSKHIIVLAFLMGKSDLHMSRVLVKTTPFTSEEIEVYEIAGFTRPEIKVLYKLGMKTNPINPFSVFLNLKSPSDREDFYTSYPYNLTPVYDDKPFFFEYYKWGSFLSYLANPGRGGQLGANKPIGLIILTTLLIQVFLLSLLFILFPLWKFKKASLQVPKKWHLIGYFSLLGFSYMLLEISLMQKFILFLGYPSYSISVTLLGLLLFSGLGSLFAGYIKMPLRRLATIALLLIVLINIVYLIILSPIFNIFLSSTLTVRVIITLLILAPLGLLMGIPFPTGLKELKAENSSFIPWAWGVNGALSVFASVLAIILAMGLGFKIVQAIAAISYLFAIWLFPYQKIRD